MKRLQPLELELNRCFFGGERHRSARIGRDIFVHCFSRFLETWDQDSKDRAKGCENENHSEQLPFEFRHGFTSFLYVSYDDASLHRKLHGFLGEIQRSVLSPNLEEHRIPDRIRLIGNH